MRINFPMDDHGARQSGPDVLDATTPGVGEAWIENDILLFEFLLDFEWAGAYQMTVDLTDYQTYEFLASGSLALPASGPAKLYIEFSDFPLHEDRQREERYQYKATLTFMDTLIIDDRKNEGRKLLMNIYRG